MLCDIRLYCMQCAVTIPGELRTSMNQSLLVQLRLAGNKISAEQAFPVRRSALNRSHKHKDPKAMVQSIWYTVHGT